MKKLAIAIIVAASAFVAQTAEAQTLSERDRVQFQLNDARDMSTGLPMNAPARSAAPAAGNWERDRAITRLTDGRDMSTGFVK